MSNVFERTAIYSKEGGKIKRIPWDLIAVEGGGFFASPMPISLNPFAEVGTGTSVMEVQDGLYDDNNPAVIDEVVGNLYFKSENDFMAKFEGAFGYYDSDPSTEYGYPRVY